MDIGGLAAPFPFHLTQYSVPNEACVLQVASSSERDVVPILIKVPACATVAGQVRVDV